MTREAIDTSAALRASASAMRASATSDLRKEGISSIKRANTLLCLPIETWNHCLVFLLAASNGGSRVLKSEAGTLILQSFSTTLE